jgi:Holliday junction resolvase RusA-like endonuclease
MSGGAEAVRLVLLGAPRTKKNSSRVLRFGRKNRIVPSAPYLRWRDAVVPQLERAWAGHAPIAFPVNVAALFFRDAARGDAVGYYQGLADALEEAHVVEDDKWIVTWDGSRLAKDAERPRVELEIRGAEGGES